MVNEVTEANEGSRRRCVATTAGGQPCKAPPLAGGDLCFWHSPKTAKDRVEAGRKGGYNRRRRPTEVEATAILVKSLGDAIALLAEEINLARDVAEPGLNRLRAIAYALLTWAKLYETGELAGRVEALEAALKAREVNRRARRLTHCGSTTINCSPWSVSAWPCLQTPGTTKASCGQSRTARHRGRIA